MKYSVASIALGLLIIGDICRSFQLGDVKSAPRQQCQTSLSPLSFSKIPHHRTHSHSSSLFPTPMAKDINDIPGDGPSRKRDVVLSVMRKVMLRFVILRKIMSAAIQSLMKRAKSTKATALLINILLFGFVAKEALPSLTGNSGNGAAVAAPTEISYSRFLDHIDGKDTDAKGTTMVHVDNVNIESGPGRISYRVLRGETRSQRAAIKKIKKNIPTKDIPTDIPQINAYTQLIDGKASADLLTHLRKNQVDFKAAASSSSTSSTVEAGKDNLLPTLAMGAIAYRIYMNGGGSISGGSKGGPGTFSKKKSADDSAQATSFDDVEGIDNAKHDVMELVDTLRNPEKYSLVGARAPTGLLLEGPPGTGKTTLARATASMADVPLLHCSGSDFVEKYAGTGASRVRKLFAKAQKLNGPCIIFIDEVDALGKKRRDSGGNGSSDEAEQTLNALLTCMDGLDSDLSNKICVLGATNRKDVLDPALVRPGRFDRIIKVDLPDEAGRERILRVHASKLLGFQESYGVDPSRPYSLGRGKSVDLSAVAEATDGLSGAELEFVVNEAAIRAVRRVSAQLNKGIDKADIDNTVYPQDFEASVDAFFESRDKSKKNGNRQMGFTIA